jgi:hypothetical protein
MKHDYSIGTYSTTRYVSVFVFELIFVVEEGVERRLLARSR